MLWQVAMRYLRSHKRQTIVCVFSVAISVTMFLAMYSLMSGFKDKFIIETVKSSGHIVINDEPRESKTPILARAFPDTNALLLVDRSKPRDEVKKIKNPEGLMRKLRSMPGIVAVAPEVTGEAIATYGSKTMTVAILGVDPAQQMSVTTIGEKVTQGGFSKLYSVADGLVVGRGVALVLGAKLGDSVMLASSTGGRTLAKIVGIFDTGVTPTDYSRVYMLQSNAQTLLDKRSVISRLILSIDDYTQAPSYASQIEAIAGYKTESWQENNSSFLKIFVIQDAMTFIITGSILIVAAFGVLNILVMTVLERVNDIAILKSFGCSRRDITMIFLFQGVVIGFVGATLGLIMGKLAIEGLSRLPVKVEGLIKAEGLLMSEHLSAYIVAFFASMIVTMLAAVYPARRAAKFDPVEVIRGAH